MFYQAEDYQITKNRFLEAVKSFENKRAHDEIDCLVGSFYEAEKFYGDSEIVPGKSMLSFSVDIFSELKDLNVDTQTLSCALFTGLVDLDIDEEKRTEIFNQIKEKKGNLTYKIIESFIQLEKLEFYPKRDKERQAEYFHKLLLSLAYDLRVIFIMLAYNLVKLEYAEQLDYKTAVHIAFLSEKIYAPLSHRFGIGKIKWRLEDWSLKILQPDSYKYYAGLVADRREVREKAIPVFIEPIKEHLEVEGINAHVFGRAKHLYSIYNKILKRKKSFEEILDLLAVRIIVDTEAECYQTLSLIHSLYEPLLDVFGDYIARPKKNMYQSLHTKVLDENGRIVEVQIRTRQMDLVAEMGVAAHWMYKEKGEGAAAKSSDQRDFYQWVREVVHENSQDQVTRGKHLEINLFKDSVFVFTPYGDLVQLPEKATPLDFAFAIHTDLGLRTTGAKVNGRIVTLDHKLTNLDRVDILAGKVPNASRDWLKFIRAPKARAKIKRYLKQERYEEMQILGKDLFKQGFAKTHPAPTFQEIGTIAEKIGRFSINDFYAAIGAGDISLHHIINTLNEIRKDESDKEEEEVLVLPAIKKRSKDGKGIKVEGMDNLEITFAGCCSPVAGEKIIGFISKNRGIVVHRLSCANAKNLMNFPSRLIKVKWEVEDNMRFNALLRLYTDNRPNMIHEISHATSKAEVRVIGMNYQVEDQVCSCMLEVEVESLEKLNTLTRILKNVPGVDTVSRQSM